MLGAGYALAVVLAVVLTGPVGGVLWTGASVLAYAVIGDPALAALRGSLFPVPGTVRVDVAVQGVVWGVLLVLIAGVERRLRLSAVQRAREARQHTAEREAAVRGRQQLLAQFARQVDRERALLAAVQEVATPVLPLDNGTVLVPVSGRLDEARADRLVDAVLAGVEAHSADLVILDVSTLVAVDAEAAAYLIRALRGARLAGSACALVGVRPPVARALASLDVDLASVPTYATLREGLTAVRPRPPAA
jgi:anti-anti-sigma regulatory factor